MVFIKKIFKTAYHKIRGDTSNNFLITTGIFILVIFACLYWSLSFDIDIVALIITAIVYTSINMVIRNASFKANEEKRMNDMTDSFVISFITTCLLNDHFLKLSNQYFDVSILSFFKLLIILMIIFTLIMLILYLTSKVFKRQRKKNHWNAD
ncbi:hypothetical protein ACWEX2_13410 [Staphylococcus xylosus]|uniref:Uncharacterized protein n=1 Tax=Staphylococcus xylosus TaxID=1288 RepID=A0AAQ0LWI7_STAXY|nr:MULTISPECIES: hypothetical protein [Staphylococcus]RIL91052.1 hypothetical protein BUY32_04915 [Staphylococcus cohnii]RIM90628.1 hypothetical protein BU104_13460 [Staphylococcus xylosus]